MTVILDTSVLIAVLLGEPSRDRIIQETKGADLIAPASLHWEVGNAFSAMFKRGRLTADVALRAIRHYQHVRIQFVRIALAEALQIAEDLSVYAYDAYMLEAARRYHSPLLTLDGGLKEAASRLNIDLLRIEP